MGDGDAKLPSNLDRLNLLGHFAYGNFVIRVLEPLRPGQMQAACIVSATNLVVQR